MSPRHGGSQTVGSFGSGATEDDLCAGRTVPSAYSHQTIERSALCSVISLPRYAVHKGSGCQMIAMQHEGVRNSLICRRTNIVRPSSCSACCISESLQPAACSLQQGAQPWQPETTPPLSRGCSARQRRLAPSCVSVLGPRRGGRSCSSHPSDSSAARGERARERESE